MAQQERALRTRAALLAAAAVEFDANGYLATRLADIATRARVTRGSLYFHFESKAHLAEAVVTDRYDQWNRHVTTRRDQGHRGVALMILFAHDLVTGFRDDVASRAAIRLIRDGAHVEKPLPTPFDGWLDQVRLMLEEARVDGELGAHVKIDEAAWLIVANLFGIQEMGDRLEQRQGICERLDSLWLYLLPGLGVRDPAATLAGAVSAV
jgi:AcrR family transcriptional regulator